jgi:hypothetical protein
MRITKATYKSFIKKNQNNLYFRSLSNFDGMVDCVMPTKTEWKKVENWEDLLNNKIGWLVGSSRDYFTPIENGIEVYNCCGSFQIKTS